MPSTRASVPSEKPTGLRRSTRALALLVAALIAVLAGVGLAIAPVQVSDVRVAWPEVPTEPESTSLMLTNQTPYSIEVGFTADAVEEVVARGGVVTSTIDPAEPTAGVDGLLVTATEQNVSVAIGGEELLTERGSTERWQITSSTAAGTVVTADGVEVAAWPNALPPQIDGLYTDAAALPADALVVDVHVVDDYNSIPTVIKYVLMGVLWLALAAVVALLLLSFRDTLRETGRPPLLRRLSLWLRTLGPIDLAVVAGLALWVFIGPMTDDDGYYAAMSLSYGDAGYVGNYYQMFNQPFAPFTWFWEFLYYWQELGGRSPVWLRLPALIAAVIGWFIARTLVRDRLAGGNRALRWGSLILLGLLYCGWWFAFAIGTRPEIVGAAGSVAVIALVLRSLRRRSLVPAFVAAAIAGLAFAAHPTGVVAFAPLLLSVAGLWRIASENATLTTALARTAGVLSAGAIALFAAFRDASLSDVLAGRATFAAVEIPLDWTNEINRYSAILAFGPSGSYAKRGLVLVALVLLVWFIVAHTFLIGRKVTLPPVYRLTGWTFGLSLILLWITPSKWTHHFGALSAVGPLMIVLVLALTPVLLAHLRERPAPWLAPVAVASLVPAIVVGLGGPNTWAYSWNQGMFRAGRVPGFDAVDFDSLAIWGGVAVVVLAVAALYARRRDGAWLGRRSLYAAFALVAVFATVSTGYLTATFGLAAVRGLNYYTPGGANLVDPTASRCRIDDAMQVWDASSAVPLTPAGGEAVLEGSWRADAGWPESDPQPALPAGTSTWGSLTGANDAAGTLTSPLYEVPAINADQRLIVQVGGLLDDEEPNSVRMEFSTDAEALVTRTIEVDDPSRQPGWRTLSVPVPQDIAENGGFVRVLAEDATTVEDEWIGVSAPLLAGARTLDDVVPDDAGTAVSWMSSFWFPCQRPISIANGIFERPVMSTSWGPGDPDNIWRVLRGGQMVAPARSATISVPATELSTAGDAWGNLQLLQYDTAEAAYTLTSARVTVPGWVDPFGPTGLLVEAERLDG
jgi:hypothetical protein